MYQYWYGKVKLEGRWIFNFSEVGVTCGGACVRVWASPRALACSTEKCRTACPSNSLTPPRDMPPTFYLVVGLSSQFIMVNLLKRKK